MNGIFKFKENIFLKYKKEITLTVGAVLTLVTVVKFVPGEAPTSADIEPVVIEPEPIVVEEVVQTNGFRVLLDGLDLGIVASVDDAQTAINESLKLVISELGYNPESEPVLEYKENFSLEENYIDTDSLALTLKDHVISTLPEVKVKAYVMRIGDGFTVAMNSKEEVIEVLKNAQSIYINSEDMVVDIDLAIDKHNSMIIKPEVSLIKEDPESVSRTFTGNDGDEDDEANQGESEVASEEITEIEEEKDPKTDGTTVAVEFAEEVMIVETYVFEEDLKSIEDATELITKENQEPKVYNVVSGDSPSVIAENNDMKLSELYSLNPDLKGNERKMQIGDELIVMVPEPELSVATKEEVTYIEAIGRGVTYVDNPDKYKGWTSTIDNGYSGTLEVTAILTKVNGAEIDREITNKEVITEPKNRVVSRGTKALPPKGATGQFIAPLSEYRITSRFGQRWGGFHYGVDMAVPSGNNVMASDGGVVTIAGWYGNYGYLVEIDHGNGIRTRYGHNSKIKVSVGEKVSQYQTIALSGNTGRSTGPHVHFEIRFDGVCANPLDYIN